MEGDIVIPDHPLVNEVMQDVLQVAMDLEGLNEILRGIASGTIRCLAVDTPVPSQFAHELINANVYAFLDDAGLEERRARAVSLRRALPDSVLDGAGKLDQAAINTVRGELWPDLRDEHELHDLLHSLVAFPLAMLDGAETEGRDTRHWPLFYERLTQTGRARTADVNGVPCWVATERLPQLPALWPPRKPSSAPPTHKSATTPVTNESTLKQCVQGWLQILGPTTATAFAHLLNLDPAPVYQTFLALEMQGLLMRGAFEHAAIGQPPANQTTTAENPDYQVEWCERRILQRIHRLTLSTLRKQVEPVTPAVYMRWLLNWQHLAPQSQLAGEEGLFQVLHQLEGFEAPAVEWERTLLPARVANYSTAWLDQLCLSGAVGWGRISPHPAWSVGEGAAPRRVIPTNAAPITFYIRETADWLPHALAQLSVDESVLAAALSPDALRIRTLLQQRGACFAADLQRITGLTRQQTAHALGELATAGLAAADGFDQLRALMDPRRKPSAAEPNKRPGRTTAGRWSLLNDVATNGRESESPSGAEGQGAMPYEGRPTPAQLQSEAIAEARRNDAALESFARMLLARYGILFRDLLSRESNAPKWRELLNILRRLEARGELRGGRFVTGFGGEQYALPEAVESLRLTRARDSSDLIPVAAADPLNLIGIVIPGERVSAIPGKEVRYRNGSQAIEDVKAEEEDPALSGRAHRFPLAALATTAAEPAARTPGLF